MGLSYRQPLPPQPLTFPGPPDKVGRGAPDMLICRPQIAAPPGGPGAAGPALHPSIHPSIHPLIAADGGGELTDGTFRTPSGDRGGRGADESRPRSMVQLAHTTSEALGRSCRSPPPPSISLRERVSLPPRRWGASRGAAKHNITINSINIISGSSTIRARVRESAMMRWIDSSARAGPARARGQATGDDRSGLRGMNGGGTSRALRSSRAAAAATAAGAAAAAGPPLPSRGGRAAAGSIARAVAAARPGAARARRTKAAEPDDRGPHFARGASETCAPRSASDRVAVGLKSLRAYPCRPAGRCQAAALRDPLESWPPSRAPCKSTVPGKR
eukprot:scaffold897_cov402-Prasinococcus_capsulatus_cf.AAC.30